jgi:hypothetical protein
MTVLSKVDAAFGALVLAQAAHSTEECTFRLWETFPPARFIAGLASSDLERGFIVLNVCLVALGAWCYFWPVRRQWPSATPILWVWIVVETINGVNHPLWSVLQGGYTPGLVTAPILLILALHLARLVRRSAATP